MPPDLPLPQPAWRDRLFALLLIAYFPLLVTALVTRRAVLSIAAGLVLLSVLLWPSLIRGGRVAWTFWGLSAAGGAALIVHGNADAALLLLPVLINAAIAGFFARTLLPGNRPLVARAIVAIEGEERLALPGVAGYALGLTWAWAIVLGAQALVLLAGAVLAVPGGILDDLGIAPAFAVSRDTFIWYGHVGSYGVIALCFAAEFAYRHWHLRHLPHLSARQFASNLSRNWRSIVHQAD
ncbi:xanthomonadin biosynthesis protein [Tahibacter amnicola]|uniref:Xanthomonadin biosynthesis protein n=1 Tax=Tahibacter amnicola TaxID=2976241 RepID=A0ABY6BG17_9GAMM|nr:xanthomonadin biosynthesis protein [Tahibacter amnicola]UXI68709.1 xanthomonadin biosynthesis protein [Tahibacter amnicola]